MEQALYSIKARMDIRGLECSSSRFSLDMTWFHANIDGTAFQLV